MVREERAGTKAVKRHAWTVLQVILVVGLLYLAYRLLAGQTTPKRAVPALGAVAVAVVVAVLTPFNVRELISRTAKVTLGPFAFELLRTVEAAADRTPDDEPTDPDNPSAPPVDVIALRLRFEAKLAYIAKHMLGDDGETPTFTTIGSLSHDGFLPEADARLAAQLVTLRDSDLAALGDDGKARFVREADRLVGNIRATVLDGQMRAEVKEAGCPLREIPRGRARPDVLVTKADDTKYRLAPVFAPLSAEAQNLNRAKERLGKTKAEEPEVTRRVIVVPNNAPDSVTSPTSDPAVVRVAQLREALGIPRR